MIAIDTNIASQLLRPDADHSVVAWLDRHKETDLRITSVSVMEIRRGLELMPDGRRRTALVDEWARIFEAIFAGRVLPFDRDSAEIAGRLMAQRVRRGITIDLADTQIAAIAIANGASIATRNVRHFADLPLVVVDPWTA